MSCARAKVFTDLHSKIDLPLSLCATASLPCSRILPCRVDPISLDMIIKWVTEAAEDFGLVIAPRGCSCQASSVSRQDSQAQFSADTGQQQVPDKQWPVQACSPKEIIKSGIAEFLRRSSKEAIPEARRCDCM